MRDREQAPELPLGNVSRNARDIALPGLDVRRLPDSLLPSILGRPPRDGRALLRLTGDLGGIAGLMLGKDAQRVGSGAAHEGARQGSWCFGSEQRVARSLDAKWPRVPKARQELKGMYVCTGGLWAGARSAKGMYLQ